MNPEFCFPIKFGETRHYVQTVEQILKQYDQDPNAFAAMTQQGASFVSQNYSEARERESIVSCWNRILG